MTTINKRGRKMNLKKMLTALAVLLMAASPSFAADVNVTDWNSMDYPLGMNTGDTVILQNDINVVGGTLQIKNANILNLNQKTIDGTVLEDPSFNTGFNIIDGTVKNGIIKNFTSPGAGGESRGVLFVGDGGNLTVDNVTFDSNTANYEALDDGFGAAISSATSITTGATINVNNSSFLNNKSRHGGGAVYNTATMEILNSLFKNNYSMASTGGAIAQMMGTLSLDNVRFTNNHALDGGAIFNYGTLSIENSVFSKNQATGNPASIQGNGGAIINVGTISSIDNTNFIENTSTGVGSAIYNAGTIGDNVNGTGITNSKFEGNTSSSGVHSGVIHNIGTIHNITGNEFLNNDTTNSVDIFNNGGSISNIKNNTFKSTIGTNNYAIASINNTAAMNIENNTISGYYVGVSIDSPGAAVTIKDTVIENVNCAIAFKLNTNQTLNILADARDISYYGSINSLQIYNDGLSNTETTTNLSAKENRTLTFNSLIESTGTLGGVTGKKNNIIINPDTTDKGRVILNNTLSGENNAALETNLTLEHGTLQFGEYGSPAPTDGYLKHVQTLTLDGGMLSTINGHADAIGVATMAATAGAISFDWGDTISTTGTAPTGANAMASLGAVNILSTPNLSTNTKRIDGLKASQNGVTYTNDHKYTFSTTENNVTITQDAATGGLANALTDANTGTVSFSAIGDVTSAGGTVHNQIDTFNIFGNDKTITLTDRIWIDTAGQKFNIYNAKLQRTTSGRLLANDSSTVNINNSELSNPANKNISIYNSTTGNPSFDSVININNSIFDNVSILNAQNSTTKKSILNISNSKLRNNNNSDGAISNYGDLTVNYSEITDNTEGISVNGGSVEITNTDFIGNTTGIASVSSTGDTKIYAVNKDVVFDNNTTDIQLDRGDLLFDADAQSKITLNKGITSNNSRAAQITKNGAGTLALGGDNSSYGSSLAQTFNLNEGTLQILNGAQYFGSKATTTVANGTTVSLAKNGSYDNFNFGGGKVRPAPNTKLTFAIDADLASGNHDSIEIATANQTGTNWGTTSVELDVANLEGLSTQQSKLFAGVLGNDLKTALSGRVGMAKTQYMSDIYRYALEYDETTGGIRASVFGGGGNNYQSYNPGLLASPVAAQVGSYLTQVNSYEEAFANFDMMTALPYEVRQSMKYANKYASTQGTGAGGVITFDPNQIPEQDRGLWFRPYTTFENVGLKNGPTVGNVAYGTLFGGDTDIIELKHGWDAIYSAYLGYNGSHQTYDGVGIYQNGGQLGASALFYKGNFFTGLTANVGANVGEANTMFGHDTFTMLATGVASKTGYNFEFAKGKFIIQPNFLMSYTFVNTFDYTDAAGHSINSDPLNAIQIAPGLKFIGNLKNGWQPYASVQMVWNIMDQTKFSANDISLPEMSVKPYIQYGIGLQKRWGDRFTGFAQAMIRNGGRNGIALQAGFRWALGKAPEKNARLDEMKKSSGVPELQSAKLNLQALNK